MDEYPDEVRYSPVPVVGFFGAAPFMHLMDKYFTLKKLDGHEIPLIKILVKGFDEDLPRRQKERRVSFEGIVPDGILRANWMWRHYNQIPSSIAIFFDWSENDNEWRQKEGDICIKLENVRQQAKTRNIKYVVVLVKKEPSPENTYDERFNSFRKRADLDPRNIIFFVQSEAKNSTRRLEKILLKLSVDYHKEEGRFYKRLRERMNKVTQQKLLLRVHFKIAYHAEFRQNPKAALKYYHLASGLVKDMNKTKSDLEEIKVIADYINFKICKLYLDRGAVNDAVVQVHRHIKYFKPLVGDTQYQFQHWAWVSRQHKVFAEVMSLFPQYNVPKIKGWRSCAFHYHAAANYEMLRKQKCDEICEQHRNDDFVKSLMNTNKLTAYRPTRIDIKNQRYVGKGMSRALLITLGKYDEKMDPKQLEYAEFMCAVAQELIVDHSLNISSLLQKTYEFLKIELAGERTVAALAAQLGKQLYQRESYEQAKSYFDQAISRYRSEKWWELLSEVLKYSVDCCYRLNLLPYAIKHSLELLAPYIPISLQQKQEIQQRLIKALQTPNSLNSPVIVALDNDSPLINVRVQFEREKVYAHTEVEVKVLLSVNFPSPVTFNVLRLLFNDSTYNLELRSSKRDNDKLETTTTPDTNANTDKLTFFPVKQVKILSFKIPLKNETVIECNEVQLEWGSEPNNVKFIWKVQGSSAATIPIRERYQFYERTTVVVLPNPPQLYLQISHSPPAILNEYYPLSVTMTNKHEEDIEEIILSFGTSQNLESVFFLKEDEKLPGNQIIIKELLPPNSSRTYSIYFLHNKNENVEIKVIARYRCKSGFSSFVEQKESLQCVFPFIHAWEFYTTYYSPISSDELRQNEVVLLCFDLSLTCQTTLELLDIDLVMNVTKDFQPVALKVGSSTASNTIPIEILKYGGKYTFWYVLRPQLIGTYALGFASLKWRRRVTGTSNDAIQETGDTSRLHKGESSPVITQLPLPKVTVQQKLFTTTADVPSVGVLGELLPHTITVVNHTNSLQEFALVIGHSSDFLIAGDKQLHFKVHPQCPFHIQHHLIPVTLGHVCLPPFEIVPMKTSPLTNNLMQDFVLFKQKRYVFIKPSTKLPMPTL